jgi:hypothetical protein
LDAGVRARVATEPFTTMTVEGRKTFDYGTILVAVGPQDAGAGEIRELMQRAASEDAIKVYALGTGLSAQGIDLGSPSFSNLRKPQVALIVGDGMRASEAGEAWHTFDQKFHMPITLLTQQQMRQADLSRYNVLVLGSGTFSNVQSDRVKQWVEGGGTLIVYKTALNWAEREELAKIELIDAEEARAEIRETSATRPYSEVAQDRGQQLISGSIFNATLDLSHPLGYGYNSELLRVFRDSTIFMKVDGNPYAMPLRYTDAPLASGYISAENLQVIAETAAIVVTARGSGRVIAMADNPNFRAFWFGTTRLFMNAVFFGHTINSQAAN